MERAKEREKEIKMKNEKKRSRGRTTRLMMSEWERDRGN
jgi:hypothetical protein